MKCLCRNLLILLTLNSVIFGKIKSDHQLSSLDELCQGYDEGMSVSLLSMNAIQVGNIGSSVPYYLNDFLKIEVPLELVSNNKQKTCDFKVSFTTLDNRGNKIKCEMEGSLSTRIKKEIRTDREFTGAQGKIRFGNSKYYQYHGKIMGESGETLGFSTTLENNLGTYAIFNLFIWGC